MLNNQYLDLVRDAMRLTVEASDFYGTGKLPPKHFGPMIVAGAWRRQP
jgi:hypothetical protein